MTKSHEVPFVRILLPYGGGILFSYPFVSISLVRTSLLIVILLFICLMTANMFYLDMKAYRYKGFIGLVFYLFWFALGSLSCSFHQQFIKASHFANKGYPYLKIRIAEEPQYKKNMVRFKSLVVNGYTKREPGNPAVSGSLMIAVKTDSIRPLVLNYGDELIIKAQFKEIEPPNHCSEFDYKSWLATQNIYHQAFLRQQDLIKIRAGTGNPLISFALKLRARQINFYKKILKKENNLAFASALILGYKSDLDQETMNIYARTGTIHVLSVSGMHVGIVYIVLNWLLTFLDRRRWTMLIKVVLILDFIWFYTLLTGLSPSVLRSAIMISVFILSKSFVRNTNNYNIIAFAAFGLLSWNPFLIWDVGFQLSFLAVLGLIWLQPKIESWLYIKNKWLNKLWTALAVSLAAQLVTFPLSVYYFHQFPVYFLISNLFILLPAALLMYMGIFLLIFRTEALGPVFEWLISFTNSGLSKISEWPHAIIPGIWISKNELLILSTGLVLLILALSHFSKRLLFLSLVCLLCFQFLLFMDRSAAEHQRKVVTFKIGKQISKGFICGRKITLVTFGKRNEKDFNYFIKPAIEHHKVKSIKWILIKPN